MSQMDGSILIGSTAVQRKEKFAAEDRSRPGVLTPSFSIATTDDVAEACRLADAVFDAYRFADLETRARLLERVAQNILDLGDALIGRTMAESGLPRARLEGERGRTVGQLRLFAGVVREGSWLGLRMDPALPERTPLPRPDLRLRFVPLGPVAVFGASNFPLAFSVAGGDTASALAAGCPVVVKGHPAHPGASEMVGRAIQDAVSQMGLPDGVFSLLQGTSNELGAQLVQDPRIQAVGFTGSRGGGLALQALAAARLEPIPVFAEMSSVNPVVLMPAALQARVEAIATGFVASLTLGAGQFCTNPGVVLGLTGPDFDRFAELAAAAMKGSQPATMLSRQIQSNYDRGVEFLQTHTAVTLIARGAVGEGDTQGRGALFTTTAAAFLADPRLSHEVFGSSGILVSCGSMEELMAVLKSMEGQLTVSLHLEQADWNDAVRLVPLLERKAGRILVNGWPTGVEVAHAMVHGGPFPATSDSRSTSVGSLAILRFLRPVCYQAMPQMLLPVELRDDSGLNLPKMVDGKSSR